MYVRQCDLQILENPGTAPWRFRTKLELAAELVEWCVNLFKNWFQKRAIVVADGAYARRVFLKRVIATGAVVVSRLRKDAALFDLPVTAKCRGKGRPRKYGVNSISLARRGGHPQGWTTVRLVLYGKEQTVRYKTFLATYAPVGGTIRVVIVKRSAELFSDGPGEWVAFFCTDADVSAETIIESVAQRSAIEQNFHDVKEVHGAGEQQVRNVWCNVACWNLCLWLHTIVELWAWNRSGNTLKQRADRPWEATEAAERLVRIEAEGGSDWQRPSHADRLKTLKKHTLRETFCQLPRRQRAARKIQQLFQALTKLIN